MYHDASIDMGSAAPATFTLDAVVQLLSSSEATPRYVVQLCESPTAMNPKRVPRIDLLELYHLYSADARQQNGATHQVLRLGFFKDCKTAKLIMRYLGRYFDSPRVVLVDPPEIVRALRHRFVALKDSSPAPRHAYL